LSFLTDTNNAPTQASYRAVAGQFPCNLVVFSEPEGIIAAGPTSALTSALAANFSYYKLGILHVMPARVSKSKRFGEAKNMG
jgi:hypothetical protein